SIPCRRILISLFAVITFFLPWSKTWASTYFVVVFGVAPGEPANRNEVCGSTFRWMVSASDEFPPFVAGQNCLRSMLPATVSKPLGGAMRISWVARTRSRELLPFGTVGGRWRPRTSRLGGARLFSPAIPWWTQAEGERRIDAPVAVGAVEHCFLNGTAR